MQLYPTTDMKDGRHVHLRQGGFRDTTAYSDALWKVAAWWRAQGGALLHSVDLNGMLTGHSVSVKAIQKVVDSVTTPIEVGRDTRSREAVCNMPDLRARYVTIGTRAATHPEFLEDMMEKFEKGAAVAGVDTRDDTVAAEGWKKVSAATARNLYIKVKKSGVRYIVCADISRDGILSGPNVEATRQLVEDTGLDIIVPDGISCMKGPQDLHKIGIRGVIIGKVLYENRIDLKGVVRLYESQGISK